MEIRNNTAVKNTTFGMAFRKPPVAAMEQFTEFVTRKGASPVNLAKRGVKNLVERHAHDVNFDIVYCPPAHLDIVPMTEKAEDMMNRGMLPNVKGKKGVLRKIKDKYFSEDYEAKLDKASGLKKAWLLAKQLAAGIRARAVVGVKPTESLPGSMRDTSRKVKAFESAVNAQLKKEAREAAEKRKSVKIISSAFDN